ncbi:MAG: NUDIX domain-containing protein [Bacteroidales bacterium]|nr:NUDIX domain-containing protein [Bacteroidales bacterium]
MYKVYFGDRCVVIARPGEVNDPEAVVLSLQEGDDLASLPARFETMDDIACLAVETADPDAAFAEFISLLKREVAAGGLVRRAPGFLGRLFGGRPRALLFYRRGAWDMPKGHVDPGETLEQTALREVTEETGLRRLQLGAPICTTYHTWHNPAGEFVLKESHWFAMKAAGREKVVVETEEDIERYAWCGRCRLRRLLPAAWPSIRDVFNAEN